MRGTSLNIRWCQGLEKRPSISSARELPPIRGPLPSGGYRTRQDRIGARGLILNLHRSHYETLNRNR